jgi:hypothetical protein
MPSSKRKTQKTQKRNSKGKTLMTIPQLRSAFEHLDEKAMELKGKDSKTQIHEFQAAWKSIFSREVSAKAVEAYLAVKHAESRSKTNRRNTRRKSKQTGGSPLAGAPLDYQTRPGIDGVHGAFPAYVDKGLTFYNDINQHARMADCGVKDVSPHLPAGMGSNQAGGAVSFSDFASAVSFKPFESTTPPTVYQDIRSAYLGLPLPPSPAVEAHTWQYK